ncbi:hypothetical protein MACJ_002410 [Theileria orientalis]|uniref:Uncharacterized protein n=1 Tax=Theileria orientalis TaxID=68886 RepID=A0A976M5Y9_THEOR|nr:hypothetical protein MACJ_002410 [Theileria orientalis]
MLVGSVLKLLIGLSFLSQCKLWALGHGQDSSTAWFINFYPPLYGDEDTLEVWLSGPLKRRPTNGLDCPLKWLYGPLLTQRLSRESVEVKEKIPTIVPNSVSDDVHEQVEPEIEINDPHDKWLHGPSPNYLVNSGSEDKGFLSRLFGKQDPEPKPSPTTRQKLEFDSDDESNSEHDSWTMPPEPTTQLESDSEDESEEPQGVIVKDSGQTLELDSDSDSGGGSDPDDEILIPKSQKVAGSKSDLDPEGEIIIPKSKRVVDRNYDSDEESKPKPKQKPKQKVAAQSSNRTIILESDSEQDSEEQQKVAVQKSEPTISLDSDTKQDPGKQQKVAVQKSELTISLDLDTKQYPAKQQKVVVQSPNRTISLESDTEQDPGEQPKVVVQSPNRTISLESDSEQDSGEQKVAVQKSELTISLDSDSDEELDVAYEVGEQIPEFEPEPEHEPVQYPIAVQEDEEDIDVPRRRKIRLPVPLELEIYPVESQPRAEVKQYPELEKRQHELESDPETDVQPSSQPEAKPIPELEKKPVPETEAKAVPEPEKKPPPEPEPEPKPEVKPIAELKLYALDPNIPGSYMELDEGKFELMEELGEVNYSLKNFVHCHLITYSDEKVWKTGEYGVEDPESISCDPLSGQITVNGTKKAVMYRDDGSGNWQYVSSFNYAPDYKEILKPKISAKDKTGPRETISFPQGKPQQSKGPLPGGLATIRAVFSDSFKLFTEDEKEVALEMDHSDYEVTREGYETDCEFKPDKKCTEIKFDNKKIWRKGDHNINVPTSISYNEEGTQVTIRDGEKEVTFQRDLLGTWKYQSTARYDSEYTPLGLTQAIMGSADYRTDFGALFRQHPSYPDTIPYDSQATVHSIPPILKAALSDSFKLFTEDEKEVALEMDHSDYEVTSEGYETDYEFKPDKKCTEIKFDNKKIWRKGDHNINVPTSISYNEEGTQVTIRDGEKAVILVRDQSGDWSHQTSPKYHYDFDSVYRSSHHDEDYSMKPKMRKLLAKVDLKTDKSSAVEYNYKEENKKKKMTYTTKPGYEFGTVKYDGKIIWETNHRDGFCSEVIFDNISSKVRSVILKMDNGTQKEFNYSNKKWTEFLPPQPVAVRASAEVKEDSTEVSEPSRPTSQILESGTESESDVEIHDTGIEIDLSGSETDSTDTEELGSGSTIQFPQSSPGIIVKLPPFGSGTTMDMPESEPELTAQPAVSSGTTMDLPLSDLESISPDTSTGVTMGMPQSDTEGVTGMPSSGSGVTMEFPNTDIESIIEVPHSDTESLFEMPKPGSSITVKRPESDGESPAGDQLGSIILDPNLTHNTLCQQLKAEKVDDNVNNGILCFNSKFVDMSIWSKRYGKPNLKIPILRRSLHALFYNGSRWNSQ